MSATLIDVLIGYLISMGVMPIRRTIDFERGELQLIRLWMKRTIALLPTVALTIGLTETSFSYTSVHLSKKPKVAITRKPMLWHTTHLNQLFILKGLTEYMAQARLP